MMIHNPDILEKVDSILLFKDLHPEKELNPNEDNPIYINIYRYKFTIEFMEELYRFSKIHQYDHRHDFKEAWNVWINENEECVYSEVRRLMNIGYDGDILDKMFKSARYYFRKKNMDKKELKKRKVYIGTNKELIEAMDSHIQSSLVQRDYKPSAGFLDFCKKNTELIKEEIQILVKNGMTETAEIQDKIKKTYKNRYFMRITK